MRIVGRGVKSRWTPPAGSHADKSGRSKERISPVAMLSKKAIEKVEEVARAYEFQNEMVESLISNLVVMGAEQVLRREARLRVEIGEGEGARVVEIDFPEKPGSET